VCMGSMVLRVVQQAHWCSIVEVAVVVVGCSYRDQSPDHPTHGVFQTPHTTL